MLILCALGLLGSIISPTSAQEKPINISQAMEPQDNSGAILLTPDIVQKIKEKNPSFWTYDDLPDELKAMVVEQGGMMMLVLPKGQKVTLPNGDVIEDGSTTFSNGMKHRLTKDDSGTVIRSEFIKPDGQLLKKGETFKANDGRTYRAAY
jgi:hypothetical protein